MRESISHNNKQKDKELECGEAHKHPHKGFRVALTGAEQYKVHGGCNHDKKAKQHPAQRMLPPHGHCSVPHQQSSGDKHRKHGQTY